MKSRIAYAKGQLMILVRNAYGGLPPKGLLRFKNLTIEVLEYEEREGVYWITKVRFMYLEKGSTHTIVFVIWPKGVVAWTTSNDPDQAHDKYYAEETLYQLNSMTVRLAVAMNRPSDEVGKLVRYRDNAFKALEKAKKKRLSTT